MITSLTCNACSAQIPLTGTRIICRVCANYDLCTSCHTLGRFSDSHEVQHETLVLYPPTSISQDPYHVPPAPPPPLPPRSNSSSNNEEINPRQLPPPLSTRILSTTGKLLSSNNTPTKRLTDISDAVFAYLNKTYPTANQHLLNPGHVANFYELMGMPPEGNVFGVCISVMNGLGSSLDNIDPEIAHFYDQLGIEYSLITRASATPGGLPMVMDGMPVLSHRGFRQLLVCEILEDPGRMHSVFGQLVRWAIFDDRGRAFEEVPWGMFPAEPDPAFVVKVTAVAEEFGGRLRALFARLKREREEEDLREHILATQLQQQQMHDQRMAAMQLSIQAQQRGMEAALKAI
ncbi:hypothetical protein L873DRAFT_1699901 [Choiromyces venosus 120613-1]|uniref:ZZ-type domain-containing protein n=1 Tax=Choiromyces venosus 120613-1 TaxID=1336337 RepID=A0A3N4JE06_9PEZI|nr:hypothetical protein L873DRAFT_1699901 [Choiromyces venosus 120613-1]